LSISVQNCGEPIAPELRAMLFSPFARGARPRRGPAGLGLGLYLSELIVSALGGRIDVESTHGGTLFEVILPR
jgi:sigma-B regulation protein RsbU (phosphoserine phosphatase)